VWAVREDGPSIQFSIASAMARASSSSTPRYLKVLSILVWPNRSGTARRLPVFLKIWVIFVRRIECVPYALASRPIDVTQSWTILAYYCLDCPISWLSPKTHCIQSLLKTLK